MVNILPGRAPAASQVLFNSKFPRLGVVNQCNADRYDDLSGAA